MLVVIVAQFFCGMSSITANSRMIYAFSRDGAVPFHDFWHHVSKRSPYAGPLGVVRRRRGVHPLRLPYMYNAAAYYAVTSIAVIGLYIAYLTPVFLRRINPKRVRPGPWKLSKTWGPIIGWIAIVWVIFICILLMLPQYSPITRHELQLRADRGGSSSSASPVSGMRSRPASGSRARRSRARRRSSPRSSATCT